VEHNLFAYAYQEQMGQYVIESREFQKIKQRLLFSLTNFGKPWITVVDGNYRNRGELLLRHEFNGVDLRVDLAAEVLPSLQALWSRPVHLRTVVDNKPTLLSYDGKEHSTRTLGDADDPREDATAKSA
jgi:stage V sporulation protein R